MTAADTSPRYALVPEECQEERDRIPEGDRMWDGI